MVIYGAGKYARILCSYWKLQNKYDEVKYFVVTQERTSNYVFDKKVLMFEEAKEQMQGETVWIAIAGDSARRVQEFIHGVGITDTHILTNEMYRQMYDKILSFCSSLPIEKNKIFFDCHKGMVGYRCNCKYIADYLLKLDKNLHIVWNIQEGVVNDLPEEIQVVFRYSLEYFEELLTSRILIENTHLDYDVPKREGQYWIETWHGVGPFKKTGVALRPDDQEYQIRLKKTYSHIDLFVVASEFNRIWAQKDFLYEGEIVEYGMPRNDIFRVAGECADKVKNILGIEQKKKILLYAPTYRDEWGKSFDVYNLKMETIITGLEQKFGGTFELVYRFHHVIYRRPECKTKFHYGIDASEYPDTQELLAAADVLITDYSSIMWDFSLQRKPIFLYHNDVDEYLSTHGLYSSPSDWPYPQAHSQEEMELLIKKFDEKEYKEAVNDFLAEYGSTDDGHATEKIVKRLLKEMEQ